MPCFPICLGLLILMVNIRGCAFCSKMYCFFIKLSFKTLVLSGGLRYDYFHLLYACALCFAKHNGLCSAWLRSHWGFLKSFPQDSQMVVVSPQYFWWAINFDFDGKSWPHRLHELSQRFRFFNATVDARHSSSCGWRVWSWVTACSRASFLVKWYWPHCKHLYLPWLGLNNASKGQAGILDKEAKALELNVYNYKLLFWEAATT